MNSSPPPGAHPLRSIPLNAAGLPRSLRSPRARTTAAYGFAVAASLIALWMRLSLTADLVGYPFITFFPAVILTTFFCGLGPGILAALLCGLFALYFFIPPTGTLFLRWPDGYVAIVFYSVIVGIDIVLIETMNRALERLREQRLVTERLYSQQRTMFQELQHRVANNMALVSAILKIQLRRVKSGAQEAPAALNDAIERIDTIARVHRRLYDPGAADTPFGDHLDALCRDLMTLSSTEARATVTAEPLVLDLKILLPLALLVTEVILNALKHAAMPGRELVISIDLRQDDDVWRLDVADNGPGMEPWAGEGLGSRIMQSLASQIDARYEICSACGPAGSPGTRFRIRFPA